MSRDVVRWRENLRQIDLKAQLKLAEEKLAEFDIEWDGDKYVFTPTQTSTRPTCCPYHQDDSSRRGEQKAN